MQFGKNLQALRKSHNLSQEALADQLDVSRQAISKWESGAGLPELDKLVTLAELFDCKLDDLLRGSVTTNNHTDSKPINTKLKADYDYLMDRFSRWISIAVGLILFGTVPLLGLADFGAPYQDYGLVIFLFFVAIAAPIFVLRGIQLSNFKLQHPKLDNFYSQAEIDTFNRKFTTLITSGIAIILLGLVIFVALVTSRFFGTNSSISIATFMFFVAIGAPIFVNAGIQKGKYDIATYNHENTTESKAASDKIGKICGVIMMLATLIYLLSGFLCDAWTFAWFIFPIGGICCGVVGVILDGRRSV